MPVCWLCGELIEIGADHTCLNEPASDEPVPERMLQDMQGRLADALRAEHEGNAAPKRKKKAK
jgi:hypothetical protein